MRILLVLSMLFAGCASHTAIPGPLRSLGRTPPPLDLRPSSPATVATRAMSTTTSSTASRSRPQQAAAGLAMADSARHYLRHVPRGYRDDCSGFVCAVANRAGHPLGGNTASMWEAFDNQGLTHTDKVPAIGDLAFFDNTYDRNRDGRNNDDLTHIGIVVDVDEDGTITVAHSGTSQGRSELRMNLRHPRDHRGPDGTIRNDYLRRQRSTDRSGTPHLAGEMWRGFATLNF